MGLTVSFFRVIGWVLLFNSFRCPIPFDPFDILLINGRVIDGSGGHSYLLDIGIRKDRIIAMGKLESDTAHHVENVENRMLIPFVWNESSILTPDDLIDLEDAYNDLLHSMLSQDKHKPVDQLLQQLVLQLNHPKDSSRTAMIGKGFRANILIVNPRKTFHFTPLTRIPRDLLDFDFAIYHGKKVTLCN